MYNFSITIIYLENSTYEKPRDLLTRLCFQIVEPLLGIEPRTYGLQNRRSDQLS